MQAVHRRTWHLWRWWPGRGDPLAGLVEHAFSSADIIEVPKQGNSLLEINPALIVLMEAAGAAAVYCYSQSQPLSWQWFFRVSFASVGNFPRDQQLIPTHKPIS